MGYYIVEVYLCKILINPIAFYLECIGYNV